MNKKLNPHAQWAIMTLLIAIGLVALLYTAGDTNIPLTFGQWLLHKTLGVSIIAADILIAKWLCRKGIITI